MRQGQQNRRGRGRNTNQHNSHSSNNNSSSSSSNNGNRRGQNPLSRNYESNGPGVKIRGNAAHVAEKYMTLARDAVSSGDSVMAENYLQHAEHYNRIIMAAQTESGVSGGMIQRPRQLTNEFGGLDDEMDGEGDDQHLPAPSGMAGQNNGQMTGGQTTGGGHGGGYPQSNPQHQAYGQNNRNNNNNGYGQRGESSRNDGSRGDGNRGNDGFRADGNRTDGGNRSEGARGDGMMRQDRFPRDRDGGNRDGGQHRQQPRHDQPRPDHQARQEPRQDHQARHEHVRPDHTRHDDPGRQPQPIVDASEPLVGFSPPPVLGHVPPAHGGHQPVHLPPQMPLPLGGADGESEVRETRHDGDVSNPARGPQDDEPVAYRRQRGPTGGAVGGTDQEAYRPARRRRQHSTANGNSQPALGRGEGRRPVDSGLDTGGPQVEAPAPAPAPRSRDDSDGSPPVV